ncbi:hypothetical protein [Paraliobacillus sp. X-1268]|uniref:hypothetical protein n=1 Tax=Paraliobacillus sp. X-1268 TaxID=2213193 RepID=UPI0018E58799|nr:hypothetical protein [Paraliobacillus sp. X-1268]
MCRLILSVSDGKMNISVSSEIGDTPAGTARAEDPLGTFFVSELAEAVPAERESILLEKRFR